MNIDQIIEAIQQLKPDQQTIVHARLEEIMSFPEDLRSQTQAARMYWLFSPRPVVKDNSKDRWAGYDR